MPADVETMFAAGATPWHGLGTVVSEAVSMSEVLKLAGLDWEVRRHVNYIGGPVDEETGRCLDRNAKKADPTTFSIVRSSDGKKLGTVKTKYKTFQNQEALEFLDGLVDSGELKYESAGSLGGGRRVWVMARTPEEVTIAGDQYQPYLFITTSHDGSAAITAAATPVRIVCSNTLGMAVNGAKQAWSITHRQSAVGRLQEARETIGLSFEYLDDFTKQAEQLAGIQLTDERFEAIISRAFPKQSRQHELNVQAVMDNYRNSDTLTAHRGTAWGGIQALTEWDQHQKAYRGADAKLTSSMFSGGWAAKIVESTRRQLLASA